MSMKHKLEIVGFVACLAAGFSLGDNQKDEPPTLELENIEALASGEELSKVKCYGYGSVDCNGYWVEIKITF